MKAIALKIMGYHIFVNQSITSFQILYYVKILFNFAMRITVLGQRIVANFPQYNIVVRYWRHAYHTCIPERDKASFHS